MDPYQRLIAFEEQQARERSTEKDSESFFHNCTVIRNCMDEISRIKSERSDDAKEKIRELQVEAGMAFLELKNLNRMEKFRMKAARDELVTAKTNVDSKHLQLQNLLYEVDHLKKEVSKCLLFRSKDENIDLVPEEEFYVNAPPIVSRPEETQNDPHQKRLARLEFELMQRKELSEECEKLGGTIKSVEQEIESKRARLDNLNPQLKAILDASKPLQESLGIPLDKIKVEHEKASFLPSHLYIIYAKATAYRDACDSTLIVCVEGDEEEAKRVNSSDVIEDSDSENEGLQENSGDEPPVHKKRHNKISKEARQEEKKNKYIQRHPLSVKIVVSFKDDTKMKLQFFWMSFFKIITVESDLLTVNLGGISVGDMLVPESVLRELYPGDIASDSPNPANMYQISQFKMQPFTSLNLGLPYKWAQKLGGLNFIPTEPKDQKTITKNLGQGQFENVIKQIKNRVKARLELCSEIRHLESGNLSVSVSDVDPIPQKVSSTLHKFVISSWKNYCGWFGANEIQLEFFSSSDVIYETVLRRGNSDLTAFIAIKPDYPKVPAIFRIKMAASVGCPQDISREIEREVNVMWDKPPLLSAQLQRLRACFDIYLETENLTTKEKIFFQQCRGRTRSRPLKYVEIGGGIFTQR